MLDSKRAPRREELKRGLIHRFVSTDLAPGEKLKEEALAKDLGVSRTPLREALFECERLGLVDYELDRGFTVSKLTSRNAREIYSIVETLECLALGCSEIDEIETASLESLNQEFGSAGERGDAARANELDSDWHATLLAACPNRLLLSMINELKLLTRRYELVFMGEKRSVYKSSRQHTNIVSALRSGSMARTCSSLRTHWSETTEHLLRKLDWAPGLSEFRRGRAPTEVK